MGVYTGYFDGAISRALSEPRVDVYECADGERVQVVIRIASNDRFPHPVRWLLRQAVKWKYTRSKLPVTGEYHLQDAFGGPQGAAKAQAYRDEMARQYPDDSWQVVSLTLNESLPLEKLRPKEFTRRPAAGSDSFVVLEKGEYETLKTYEAIAKRGRVTRMQRTLPPQPCGEILLGSVLSTIPGVREQIADLDARLSYLEEQERESRGTHSVPLSP